MLTFGGKMLKVGDGALKVTATPAPWSDYVTINGIKWSTRYATSAETGITPTNTITVHDETIACYTYAEMQSASLPDGWRMPTYEDFNTSLNGNSGANFISTLDGGNDSSGLGLYLTGYYNSPTGNLQVPNYACMMVLTENNSKAYWTMIRNDLTAKRSTFSYRISQVISPWRLIKI